MKVKKAPLNAVSLRLFALACMLLDHLWASVVPGNDWMNYVGRLAFPIFAFQTAEGYFHTSDVKQYCKRLLIFGLISEIPFNLFLSGSWVYPFHQNVMFTLLLGLLALRQLDQARKENTGKQWVRSGLLTAALALAGECALVDYGGKGVLTVVAFGMLRDFPGARLCQLAAMVLLHLVRFEGRQLLLQTGFGTLSFPVQGFAVLALFVIWAYNGQKGPRNKLIQYSSYGFYPVHFLIFNGISYYS